MTTEYKKTLVQFTDGVATSQPFLAYVEGSLNGPVVVRAVTEESVNPKTGEIMPVVKVAGSGIIVSHSKEWFISTGLDQWQDSHGKGVIIPFAEESAEDVMARVRAARSK